MSDAELLVLREALALFRRDVIAVKKDYHPNALTNWGEVNVSLTRAEAVLADTAQAAEKIKAQIVDEWINSDKGEDYRRWIEAPWRKALNITARLLHERSPQHRGTFEACDVADLCARSRALLETGEK